jgi:hypothetical protein
MSKAGTLERPAYYWRGDVDVIRVIEEYDLPFTLGNALKYVVRAGLKGDAADDMRKAGEYVRRWMAQQNRPSIRGAAGLDWMHPIKVGAHFRLTGLRKQIAIALLEGAAMHDEEPRILEALGMIDQWLVTDEEAI